MRTQADVTAVCKSRWLKKIRKWWRGSRVARMRVHFYYGHTGCIRPELCTSTWLRIKPATHSHYKIGSCRLSLQNKWSSLPQGATDIVLMTLALFWNHQAEVLLCYSLVMNLRRATLQLMVSSGIVKCKWETLLKEVFYRMWHRCESLTYSFWNKVSVFSYFVDRGKVCFSASSVCVSVGVQ